MIAAILTCVGEQGYDTTTVADVIAQAGASRKTFYEYFEDKRACFLAMSDEMIESWLARIQGQGTNHDGDPTATIETLIHEQFQMAIEQPAALRTLAVELTAAGADGLARREHVLAQLAQPLRAVLGDPDSPQSELRSQAIAGAILRIPYARARHGARVRRPRRTALMGLIPELTSWVGSYRDSFLEAGEPPMDGQTMHEVLVGGRAPGTLSLGSRGLERRGLPRGEGNVSRSFVVHSQRERILDALANLSAAQGYGASTIPEIVQEAAVSVQAFYEHFSGKEDVFLVAYEIGHRKARAIVERAYESHEEWPQAVQAGIEALLSFLASEPSFAHLAIVDALTASPRAATAAQQGTAAYAALLEPGITARQHPGRAPAATAEQSTNGKTPTNVAVEATTAALLELCLAYVTKERTRELPNLTGLASDLALRPFVKNPTP